MDEEIPYMRHAIWADAINAPLSRIVKARYYGEISYIDLCIGRILDAVEARPNPENTVICFFSDHGDLLGDHHGWQKQNFFEGACRIPFILSWPKALPAEQTRGELVSLADLFGIATSVAGNPELREGIDVLGLLQGECAPRDHLIAVTEPPGSHDFKIMVLTDKWKYIFMANGGREQLFDRPNDPNELENCVASAPSKILNQLRLVAIDACRSPAASAALEDDKLRSLPFRQRPRNRIYQFDQSFGVKGFPLHPADALKDFDPGTFKRIK